MYFDKDKSLMTTTEFLLHCPSVTILSLRPCSPWLRNIRDGDQFLRAFVEEGNHWHGVICPRLQTLLSQDRWISLLKHCANFSSQKQGDIAMPNVLPWRRVVINSRCLFSEENHPQISELILQEQVAGLDDYVY